MAVGLTAFVVAMFPESIEFYEASTSLGLSGAGAGLGGVTVEEILQGTIKKGGTRADTVSKSGGITQAERDLNALKGGSVQTRGPVKVKELADGRRAVLRTDPSTWGDHPGPTLEIQPPGGGYAKIKIRC